MSFTVTATLSQHARHQLQHTRHAILYAPQHYLSHFLIIHKLVGVYNGSKPFSVRYVLNLFMINDMYLRLHRDKRSEAFQCLVGWQDGGRAGRFHGVALHPGFRPASGDRLETTAQRERQREREGELSNGSNSYSEGCGGLHLRWEWPRVTQPAEGVLI